MTKHAPRHAKARLRVRRADRRAAIARKLAFLIEGGQ